MSEDVKPSHAYSEIEHFTTLMNDFGSKNSLYKLNFATAPYGMDFAILS